MPSMGAKKEGVLVDLRVYQGALFCWRRRGEIESEKPDRALLLRCCNVGRRLYLTGTLKTRGPARA
jgi:hypothetical protein